MSIREADSESKIKTKAIASTKKVIMLSLFYSE